MIKIKFSKKQMKLSLIFVPIFYPGFLALKLKNTNRWPLKWAEMAWCLRNSLEINFLKWPVTETG